MKMHVDEKICSFLELQEKLDFIRDEKDGSINFLNVIDLLVKEIEFLHEKIEWIFDLVPIRYKKAFPIEGENPFFTKSDFKRVDQDEYENAKIRMAALLKQANEVASSSP